MDERLLLLFCLFSMGAVQVNGCMMYSLDDTTILFMSMIMVNVFLQFKFWLCHWRRCCCVLR